MPHNLIAVFYLQFSSYISKMVILIVSNSDSKVSVYNVGDLGLDPGLGRSPREGNSKLLQYSCLENPMDGGAW